VWGGENMNCLRHQKKKSRGEEGGSRTACVRGEGGEERKQKKVPWGRVWGIKQKKKPQQIKGGKKNSGENSWEPEKIGEKWG